MSSCAVQGRFHSDDAFLFRDPSAAVAGTRAIPHRTVMQTIARSSRQRVRGRRHRLRRQERHTGGAGYLSLVATFLREIHAMTELREPERSYLPVKRARSAGRNELGVSANAIQRGQDSLLHRRSHGYPETPRIRGFSQQPMPFSSILTNHPGCRSRLVVGPPRLLP